MSTPGELLEALGREARARFGGHGGGGQATRTYRGRTIEQLIPRIQQELGPDAVIVRRREGLTGGVLGFFQHQFVEVEAMAGAPRLDVYDDTQPAAPPPPTPAPPRAPAPPAPTIPTPAPAAPAPAAGLGEPGASAYVTARLAELARASEGSAPAHEAPLRPRALDLPPPPLAARAQRERSAEMDLRALLAPRLVAERAGAPAGGASPRQELRTVAPGSHARARAGVERSLRRLGISEELARALIDGAIAHTLPLAPRAGLAQAVRLTLAQRIPIAAPLPTDGAAIVLVGGGGAGKTTCCASLLSAYRKGSSLPAGYASIIRPSERGELALILSPQIVKPAGIGTARALRAIRSVREQGLAIIDTPSVSPAGRGEIRELARVLGQLRPERVMVALPATLGATAATQLLRALAPLGADSLAITHADETDQLGVAVEAACTFGLAPEYLLERGRPGWRLRRAEPAELAGRLLP